jgi:EAL domain-containing protein (putative c-di-GMP-specific phosphodiesterase class I)
MTNVPATADLSIAFQPMIATGAQQPFAWQALAGTRCGKSFSALSATLPPERRPDLEALRISLSLRAAVAQGLREVDALLAIPVGAGAGMADALLSHLFREAVANRFPLDRIVVEINVDERGDLDCAAALAQACADRGVALALDGFAAGPLALKLLARFTPLFVKLDPSLVRNIDASTSRRLMAEGVMRLARTIGVSVLARGAETQGEHATLAAMGIRHYQLEAAALPAHQLRREPRTSLPTHRRLAHHHRAAPAPRAAMPHAAPAFAL